MVIAPALIKPIAMILVAALLWINAVAAVPIANPANLLFLIFFNNLLKLRPVDFFRPEDIIFIPTMNTAAPTNRRIILSSKLITNIKKQLVILFNAAMLGLKKNKVFSDKNAFSLLLLI